MTARDSPALRTLMSWRRSALSLAALGAVMLRLAAHRHEPVELAGGVWLIGCALVLHALAGRRLRGAAVRASPGLVRTATAIVVITAVFLALAALGG